MGISPKLLHTADQLLLLLGLLLPAALWFRFMPAIRIRVPRPRRPHGPALAMLVRLVPAFGIVAAVALPSNAAVLQRRPKPAWAQASSQVETDGPPPLPSVRPRRVPPDAASHPAIHRGTPLTRPLFPRARTRSTIDEDRNRAMDVHPAGKGLLPETYEVQLGDTLWDIAAKVLDTDEPARIARFWPRLHRANLDELGRDPNRIFPGQILRLPKEQA